MINLLFKYVSIDRVEIIEIYYTIRSQHFFLGAYTSWDNRTVLINLNTYY